ncbi:hypothetical protein RJ55_03426 [Drechmeria coniospora]|nr:hypothetical protein RJ55_03426 [Drechmeria coniospora]
MPVPPRPLSAVARPAPRSASRMSVSGRPGGGSRASDEDGRTAVRVAVRIRPPLHAADPGYDLIPQRFRRSTIQVTSETSLSVDSPQGRKLFVFDRVFDPAVTQDDLWRYLEESVTAFTQGYNVSMLAYGQSGAGKSYTMGTSGPVEQQDDQMRGVIPRAAAGLFEKLQRPLESDKSGSDPIRASSAMSQLRTPRGRGQRSLPDDQAWSLKATYVEIYNETLRDLLVPESVPPHERANVAIREDVKGNIILTGLREVDVRSVDDLMGALNFGSTIRQTDATAVNAKSSRSHAIFSLQLVQRRSAPSTARRADKRFSVPLEAMTGQDASVTTDSKLHFVDLAGSERLKNTGAQGERAREGISINAGLASLGKVISQLSSRQAGSHVSYRDSKLTRILQDSLGGNAITYMIACVTPAEFHLSETLNTVQYAQRARAIQSKPQIQRVEEGDGGAVVERLRAEVNFLREQIRSAAAAAADGPRREAALSDDRPDRQSGREAELQNRLLDSQENYSNLSQRHARLISEMAKAREPEPEDGAEDGDSATDRLNRSNSFAQAVEQVVLEYEKTIQSLEQSLSDTRTTLSSTEAGLLEKETRCAYAETINGQLQARLHKLMDRESSTENYLHDLEEKLDGHTSGEEKNATIIQELRREIARVRENEAACEDYISTLEERLAEADQDAELMQREVDRLEQVVERQRSLGKLDALLHELDNVGDAKMPAHEDASAVLGRNLPGRSRSRSNLDRRSQLGDAALAHDEHETDEHEANEKEADEHEADEHEADEHEADEHEADEHEADEHEADEHKADEAEPASAREAFGDGDGPTAHVDGRTASGHASPSSARGRRVTDKLESVHQELADLRLEHETTLYDFNELHAKYERAQRALAEMRRAADERGHASRAPESVASVDSRAHSRRDSCSSDAKFVDAKEDPRSSTSRSLSSELSVALDSAATADTSHASAAADDEATTTKPASSSLDVAGARDDNLAREIDRLQTLAREREAAEKMLANKYAELQSKHSETLDMVEELKTEMSKARAVEATSPRQSTPVIRRKSSQNIMIIDRAQRSLASLRNIAAENFKDRPEAMQSFELNLNAATHELYSRSGRIQELEADVAAAKKEMETKMTIISGLARERSSLKASPMDMSMVATLRDQLEKNERQLVEMREAHSIQEEALTSELAALRKSSKENPTVAAGDSSKAAANEPSREHDETVARLRSELGNWEGNHKTVVDAMRATEAGLCRTVEKLEAEIAALCAAMSGAETEASADGGETASESELKRQGLVRFLRNEIDEYKAVINGNATKVTELETAHAATKAELASMTAAHGDALQEAARLKEMTAKMEEQIAAYEEAAGKQRETLAKLASDHADDTTWKARELQNHEKHVELLKAEHAESIRTTETALRQATDELTKVATQLSLAVGAEVEADKLAEQIDKLAAAQRCLAEERIKAAEMTTQVAELTSINGTMTRDLEAAKAELAGMLVEQEGASLASLADQLAAVKSRMSDLEAKNKKNSRLIEELEEQLQHNFDEAQITNNRLSTLQTERNAQLEEALSARSKLQTELDAVREEHASLQTKYQEVAGPDEVRRSNSTTTIRRSPSHPSLPSPPPAIPLPPLPSAATRSASPTNGPVPSPTSTLAPGRDNAGATQATEDQEVRIRAIEKALYAERQLTQTLEEALTDLEKQSNKVKADGDAWRRRATELEGEIKELKDRPAAGSPQDNRWSMHAVEEERKKRQAAEAARKQLEERMNAISKSKKKKGSLNCF